MFCAFLMDVKMRVGPYFWLLRDAMSDPSLLLELKEDPAKKYRILRYLPPRFHLIQLRVYPWSGDSNRVNERIVQS